MQNTLIFDKQKIENGNLPVENYLMSYPDVKRLLKILSSRSEALKKLSDTCSCVIQQDILNLR